MSQNNTFTQILLSMILFMIIFSGCVSSDTMYTPKPGENSKEDIKPGTASKVEGEYKLTEWNVSTEENFDINFKSDKAAEFVQIIKGALGCKRYDVIAVIASKKEIKGFIPAIAIFEHQKTKEDYNDCSFWSMFTNRFNCFV